MIELIVLITSVVAALLTQQLSINYKQGPVKASAAVSLLFGLFTYLLIVAGFKIGVLVIIPGVAMGSSFAAMSSERVIPNRVWMTLTAIIFAGVFLFSSPYFEGNGGALGISACVSTIITLGIMRSYAQLKLEARLLEKKAKISKVKTSWFG